MSIERIKKQLEGFDRLKLNLDILGHIANVPRTFAEVIAPFKKESPFAERLRWQFSDGHTEYLDEQGYNERVRQPILDALYGCFRYAATTPFYNVHEQVELERMVLDLQKAVEAQVQQKGAIHTAMSNNGAIQKTLARKLAKKPGFFATTAECLEYVKYLLNLMHRAVQSGASEVQNEVRDYTELGNALQEVVKDEQLFITAKNKAAFTLDKRGQQVESKANKALGSEEYEGVEIGPIRNTWTARLVRPFLARMMRFWDHPSMQTVGRFSVLSTLILPFFEYLHGIESYFRFALPSWFKGVFSGRFSSAAMVATFVYATLHAFMPRIDYLTQSVFSSRDPLFNRHTLDIVALYIKEDLTWLELGERLWNRIVGLSFCSYSAVAIQGVCERAADRKFEQGSGQQKQVWIEKETNRYRFHSVVLSILGAGLNDIVISLVCVWMLSFFMQFDWYMNLLQLVAFFVTYRVILHFQWPMFVADIFLLALAIILPIAIVVSWPLITPAMLWQALPWAVGSILVPDVALALGHMVSSVMIGAKRLFGKKPKTTAAASAAVPEESAGLVAGNLASPVQQSSASSLPTGDVASEESDEKQGSKGRGGVNELAMNQYDDVFGYD